MKKVLFLMFLLLLMGLGAASVKAQVRIGGNTPPNPAAALDLNTAEGTTAGTKGLALPRVTLGSNTATLDGTTTNIAGMLVYNTGGSLSAGVYVWDGSKWTGVVGSSGGSWDTGGDGVGDTVRGVNGTYRVWCFGASTRLGCWMVDNSREGTPTYAYYGNSAAFRGGGAFYRQAVMSTGCPPGYSIPTNNQWDSLVTYLNSLSNASIPVLLWTTPRSMQGYYSAVSSNWVSGSGDWWSTGASPNTNMWFVNGLWIWSNNDAVSALSVRCVKR